MNPDTIRDAEIVTHSAPQEEKKKTSWIRLVIAFIFGVIVSIVGYRLYEIVTTPIAAVVNGTRITVAELQSDIAMMEKGAALQGIDVTDPLVKEEIETQALNNLITNELLLGAAQRSGAAHNDPTAEKTAYDELALSVGGEEALRERMTAVGLTDKTLMQNIRDRLLVDAYLENVTDIESLTVTEDEINAYVSQVESAGMTMPENLDEVRPQIEATLLAEKQQRIIFDHIEALRSEASIEIKLDGAVTAPDADTSEGGKSSDTQTVDGK